MRHPAVTVCTDHHLNANKLLEQTLQQAAFWECLEQEYKKTKLPKEKFRILIKPDLDVYEVDSAAGTDPRLAEHWIDLLAAKGYSNICVADADNAAATWLENRDIHVLADLAGYHYITPKGISYPIESLSEELQETTFDNSSVLKEASLSAQWLNAHFRILFCKNKTHEEFYYSLCLKNLIEILPAKAKSYHYYFRIKPEEAAIALLQRGDVHFCMIDAYTSNHGMQGIRHTNPLPTKTFIAGNDILLTDWAAALKMGLDPYSSSINAYALRKKGLPAKYKINGNLSVYDHWQNVPPLVAESVQARNKNPMMRQLAEAWLQQVDTGIFPFKNIADAQVNKFITPIIRDIHRHPLAYTALVMLNYLLAGLNNFINSYQTLYDKERLYRQSTELGFDIHEFSSQDYEEVETYITPLEQIVGHSRPDANGLKWRYIDESVLFEFSRTLPYDYKSFIANVDIAQSVQYMFDNIGGARVIVKKNAKGQPLHQAERDIYLPQPNWMVLFGGKPIDVCKIEALRYSKNSQSIYWRTIKSINHSADFDDGLVTFSALKKGVTQIKIVARQKFTLPLFWQVIDINYLPKVKDALVSDSYIKFFTKTIANFEAVYEGRNPQIGRTPDPLWGENGAFNHPLQADQFKNIFAVFSGIAEKWMGKNDTAAARSDAGEDGYLHFNGQPTNEKEVIRTFFKDMSNAVQKDIQFITQVK